MRQGTVKFDYSNTPDLSALDEFEHLVVSPRSVKSEAAPEEQTFHAERMSVWVQPFLPTYEGKPVKTFDWDRDLWAYFKGHLLKDPGGTAVNVRGSDISGAYVIDLGVPAARNHWSSMLRRLAPYPILFDYGTWDLSWEPSLFVSADKWMRWGFGYSWVKQSFPGAHVQTNHPITSHPMVLEKCGWSLNPVLNVWVLTWASVYKGDMILYDGEDPQTRHTLAAISYLNDGLFSWKRGAEKDPEHFEWEPGEWHDSSPVEDGRSGIWVRRATNGEVLFNPYQEPRTYKMTREIAPLTGEVRDYGKGLIGLETN